MEPLKKDLLTGHFTAHLDADGTLTLTRVSSVLFFRWTTRIALPPQAARALLNLLHRPDSRKKMGARVLQQ